MNTFGRHCHRPGIVLHVVHWKETRQSRQQRQHGKRQAHLDELMILSVWESCHLIQLRGCWLGRQGSLEGGCCQQHRLARHGRRLQHVVDHVGSGSGRFHGEFGRPQRVGMRTDGWMDGQPSQVHHSGLDEAQGPLDSVLGDMKAPLSFADRSSWILVTMAGGEETVNLFESSAGLQHSTCYGMRVTGQGRQHHPAQRFAQRGELRHRSASPINKGQLAKQAL
jgi:hypothetical protein